LINKSFTWETGNNVLEDGYFDRVADGLSFIANSDIVARFEKDALLDTANPSTMYTFTEKGSNDYPKSNN
jgi:N-ethylmaleimide reductase